MWATLEKIFAVIGAVASVVGTFVAVYAFFYPAELSTNLEMILSRLSQEPVLADHDRFAVQGIFDYNDTTDFAFGKENTEFDGVVRFVLCDLAGKELFKTELGFGKSEDAFYTKTPVHPTEAIVVLDVQGSRSKFQRIEKWRQTGGPGTWVRVAAPNVRTASFSSCEEVAI